MSRTFLNIWWTSFLFQISFIFFFLHSISFILSDTSIFKNVYLSVLVETLATSEHPSKKFHRCLKWNLSRTFPQLFRSLFETFFKQRTEDNCVCRSGRRGSRHILDSATTYKYSVWISLIPSRCTFGRGRLATELARIRINVSIEFSICVHLQWPRLKFLNPRRSSSSSAKVFSSLLILKINVCAHACRSLRKVAEIEGLDKETFSMEKDVTESVV